MSRAAGILLPIFSLPGGWGIGDLGPSAFQFVDFLVQSQQQFWQILPLGPTGYGNSPYMCFSALAGNPLLISPELLIQQGWLDPSTLPPTSGTDPTHIDYEGVIELKSQILRQAWRHFQAQASGPDREDFDRFCQQEADWLQDYALFMALREVYSEQEWIHWPSALALREKPTLQRAQQELAGPMAEHQFRQFVFAQQWQQLKAYANQRGVQLIGDLPIYVARDSVDVWANRSLFELDSAGKPLRVAGVPPDYFSKTGQLWGNPLYNWTQMQRTQYGWYIRRLRMELDRCDVVRIDHFRGFAGYFAIPAQAPTAESGAWIPGPGIDFFDQVHQSLGDLSARIIAEDLGVITSDVNVLRDRYGFKGMKILQMAFDLAGLQAMDPQDPVMHLWSPRNPYLPCNFSANYVVYTGTHDNNTTVGWFNNGHLPEADRQGLLDYLGRSGSDANLEQGIHWDLIRMAYGTVAAWAIIPMQDVLGFGESARLNLPGSPTGNWTWRLTPEDLQPALATKLAELTRIYVRSPASAQG